MAPLRLQLDLPAGAAGTDVLLQARWGALPAARRSVPRSGGAGGTAQPSAPARRRGREGRRGTAGRSGSAPGGSGSVPPGRLRGAERPVRRGRAQRSRAAPPPVRARLRRGSQDGRAGGAAAGAEARGPPFPSHGRAPAPGASRVSIGWGASASANRWAGPPEVLHPLGRARWRRRCA